MLVHIADFCQGTGAGRAVNRSHSRSSHTQATRRLS
jgi:hypothetical protein